MHSNWDTVILFYVYRFCSIIGSILHADQEYWSYYKKWLKFQQEQTFPGPVLTIFSEMISAQVCYYTSSFMLLLFTRFISPPVCVGERDLCCREKSGP